MKNWSEGQRAHAGGWVMPAIHNIIWDAGGTLFDTYPAVTRAFAEALRGLGASAPDAHILQLARRSTQVAIRTLAQESGVDAAHLEAAFRRNYDAMPATAQPPFPGVVAICAALLERGGRNFIVTHRGRDSLLALLAAHAMTFYFADMLTREDPFPRKPDPAALEALITRHDLDRAATLLVGDRGLDLEAGRAAGVHTCLFVSDADADNGDSPADITITHFGELLALLFRE